MGTEKGIQLFALLGLIAALAACASHQKSDAASGAEPGRSAGSKCGYYSGDPILKWNSDGLTMTVMSEFSYTDPYGLVWDAPAGSVTDGASIPRYLWSVIGGPFEGQYRNASILHDVAYEKHNRPWKDCDRMFYYAMRCSGVNAAQAKTMYYALFKFGHHWKFPIKRAKPVKYQGELVARGEEIPRAIPVNPIQISEARDWISNTDPSIEQIEQRANAETR
jgi:hypothetical protein